MENQIRNEIQTAVLRRIETEGLTDAVLAERLGVLPSGATVLRQRREWSLTEALCVAEKLGIKVRVEVVP